MLDACIMGTWSMVYLTNWTAATKYHPVACSGIALMVRAHLAVILDSIVVSIPACHAGDRGSIPRRGDNIFGGCMPLDSKKITRENRAFLFAAL